MKPLILIDGSSWLYRAFHALPRLTAADGSPTGAIFGMGNMLRKLLKEYEPDQIAVIFDPRGKTFRHERYPEYKANRPPVPPELSAQFDPICRLVDLLGLPMLQIDGVEADDVIATLAREAATQQQTVLVVSGDKDLAQIVNERVQLLDTMKDRLLDADGVVDKYGVRPDQIIDYLALMGDSSDNVPGIPGVGAKTAAKWLGAYADLDAIVAHADEIKGKIGERLRDHLDQLPLARDLVTVRDDLDLGLDKGALSRGETDLKGYAAFCEEFGFRRWLDELQAQGEAPPQSEPFSLTVNTVLDEAQLDDLARELEASDAFAIDTETDSLDAHQARLVGLSFSVSGQAGWYIPVGHDYLGAPQQLSLEKVRERLGPLLADAGHAKIAQHGKYDMHVLARHELPLRGLRYDTMLESYVLNATATRHDMDSLAMYYLGRRTISFSDVAGKGKKQLTFNQVALEQASEYAAEDAAVTYALHDHLWEKLSATPALQRVYDDIEQPLIPVLQAIEARGVLVSRQLLATASREFAQRMKEMEGRAYELAGREFNLNSPNQLKGILFDELGLPTLRKTPKGEPSTAEDVLQELAEQHDLPQLILDWRALAKLRSTYTEKLPESINPHTGRIHTSYHQAVAATGRLSSADPNLQNIPIRNDDGRRIRQAFVAPDGWKIGALDYSQIELRLMAHLSGDESLIDAFCRDQDIHSRTAAEVFDLAPEAVESSHRRAAKAINFGLIYGISAFGLARNLGIGRNEAQAHMDRFFERYPGVARYMEESRTKARDQGFVETMFGRRLYLPEINDRNPNRRQAAERVAINAPLQGSAADIIKLAMCAIHQKHSEDARLHMIMQVHDELVFELASSTAKRLLDELRQEMEQVVSLKVPLKVDAGLGDNWDEAHG